MNDAEANRAQTAQPTIALALGAGGARGLAHIAALEVFDELGIKPAVIAGTSMGAVIGAAYAAGVSARDIRAHAESFLRDRSVIMAALVEARIGRLAHLVARGNPLLIDGERFLDRMWPEAVPDRFEDLALPLLVVATDYDGRAEAVFHEGPLLPAVAGSMAIPGLVRPVRHGERVLVDGGAINPLPFDHLIGRADLLVAVDVTGGPSPHPTRAPGGFETMFGTLQIMQGAIVEAKLKLYRPEIVVRPAVDRFRVLDFFQARAILAAAEPAKDALKREVARHFEGHRLGPRAGKGPD
jgi:NTE family protein